jgi:ArsR family transcriptional regulator
MVMSVQSDALRVLADPLRRQIVDLLSREQLCNCHLVEETGARQTNVSNHLRALRQAGLVATEQQGRYTYYRLLPGALEELAAEISELAAAARRTPLPKRPCD